MFILLSLEDENNKLEREAEGTSLNLVEKGLGLVTPGYQIMAAIPNVSKF